MKKQIIAIAAVVLSSVYSFASEGGHGGSGGNVEPSAKADLQEIVDNFGETAWEISDRYLRGGAFKITQSPLSGSLLAVTRGVLGATDFQISEGLKTELAALKLQIIDGPCLEDGTEKDASTTLSQIGASVCLSASRLSRFPKAELKSVLIPLIFHELAHQHGFGEKEANQLQQLVSLHLKYRPIYLSGFRTEAGCGWVTETSLTAQEKTDLQKLIPPGSSWPAKQPKGREREQALMYCASNARAVGDGLAKLFNGSWSQPETTTLTAHEQLILRTYSQGGGTQIGPFNFSVLTRSLQEPPTSGYSGCKSVCRSGGVDPAYVMMLGSKAALEHIDREVGRIQDLIGAQTP